MTVSRRTSPYLLAPLVALSGCLGQPRLTALEPSEQRTLRARCEACFPSGSWRVVHSIHARLPMGLRTALIGVATWEADERLLRVMALALEGVTLLDLRVASGRVTVTLAVPPLDRGGVAEGLAEDVLLLLVPPKDASITYGALPDGRALCRFRYPSGAVVDLAPGRDGWELRTYDARGRLRRHVRARGGGPGGFAQEMWLQARGGRGYALRLGLLRVERGDADTAP